MKTILRLTAILSLLAGVCLGQGTGSALTVQVQNAGTPVVTAKKLLILNCVSGLNCAYSGGVLGITVAGGSSAFPLTVTGGVSGAVPCFTSTTTEAAGTLLAANAVVLGGGAGVCPSTSANFGVSGGQLNIGAVGTAGVLGLVGSGSGTATFTAPAVAGTVANPVVSTNVIQAPQLQIANNLCTTPAAGFFNICVGGSGLLTATNSSGAAIGFNGTGGAIAAQSFQATGSTTPANGYNALGATVVASLPAAAAGNKGQMIYVTDSTAVSAEGQTCVGSSTNAALAFSNGVVWKCF